MSAIALMDEPEENSELSLVPIQKISKDLRDAAALMSPDEARFLVDAYYQAQDNRIRSNNQLRSMGDEPHAILQWCGSTFDRVEDTIKAALGSYAGSKPVGKWSLGVHGIGPVLSAGLLAHIDIKRAPGAANIWSFAGYDPKAVWLGKVKGKAIVDENWPDVEACILEAHKAGLAQGFIRGQMRVEEGKGNKITKAIMTGIMAKRPWNATLKTLYWKIGQSFNKFQNSPKCYYGQKLKERKIYEQTRNDAGENSETATAILEAKKIGKSTEAYKWLSGAEGGKPMLPPGQIQARSERWSVKLFLSHWHYVAYVDLHGTPPPLPWVIVHGGHKEFIPPPDL